MYRKWEHNGTIMLRNIKCLLAGYCVCVFFLLSSLSNASLHFCLLHCDTIVNLNLLTASY